MKEAFLQNLEVLPGNLGNHLLISVVPLLLGFALSFPLAILAVRRPRLRYPTLTVVSVIQTIPSLALLALMVPVLVGLGWLTGRMFGFDIPALGLYPTLIALTLYSMLPMLRNMVTGILGVDPAITEAARGAGMTSSQSLWRIELPLALPVIIAGVRTATVWTVGIATLATPVGQRCLGNYIFRGLQTRDWFSVLFGCIVSALVAVFLDFMIGRLQAAAEQRRRIAALANIALLAFVVVCGISTPRIVHWFESGASATATTSAADTGAVAENESENPTIVIGSKAFTEQYILSQCIADLLQEHGFETRQRQSLGSTVVFDGLCDGEIGCYVDYSGTIWANHMKREGSAPPWQVLAEVNGWLAENHGIRSLGALGFENSYALAMRREQAEQLQIESIADLARHATKLKIGGDYEFFGRPEWQAIQNVYQLHFADREVYDATFMYEALNTEQVDVISAFSTDGRIEAYDLRVLTDPRNAVPPYDALLLIAPRLADNNELTDALSSLIGHLDAEAMRTANYMVDRQQDKKTIAEAADWLRDQL